MCPGRGMGVALLLPCAGVRRADVYDAMDVGVKRWLDSKFSEWMRVLKITRKPDREEFEMSAKVTGAGILLIGAIGFSIYFVATMLRGGGG